MNQQQRAVVQQALEALGNITNFEGLEKARAALRQLLEQPEPVQEPVGYLYGNSYWEATNPRITDDVKRFGSPRYTTPPAQPEPVQVPDWLDKKAIEPDWSHVWLLIKAASYASSRGHLSGTTNWGAAMSAYLRHETPPAQPAPVQEPVNQRAHEMALRQWDHWKQYALELQERLVKYEGGAPMHLNTTQPAQPEPVQEPVACAVCNEIHAILDADESKIIRDAKDGYPDGRRPRTLTLQERITALCVYASDWKRWCLEKENTTPPAQPAAVQDWKDRLIAQHEETILWQAKRIAELTDQQPAQPAALSLEDSLKVTKVCCGDYANCHAPCTPRGRWQAHQEPAAFVGLTDEEIDKAWRDADCTKPWDFHRIDVSRAIEAKLKEKNT